MATEVVVIRKNRHLSSVVLFTLALAFALAPEIGAQDRSAMTRILLQEDDFRLRVQAAFALGNTRDASVVPSLERALRDTNPAVRAAAATALGRIGAPRALSALEQAQNDPSAAVRSQAERSIAMIRDSQRLASAGNSIAALSVRPSEPAIEWQRVRYVVTLGEMRNPSGFAGSEFTGVLRREVANQLRVIRGVAVLSDDSSLDGSGRREIARRRLPHVRLDGAVNQVERRERAGELAVRCEVAFMLLDERERALRGELRGAATGSALPRRSRLAEQERELAEQALSGAVRSAMANAQQALAAAARY
jgi:hypothetical protein